MATQLKLAALTPPKAPNLPLSPETPDRKFMDDLENTLRLYFNQIDNFCQPFSSNTGGSFLQFPNGAFHQDGNTTITTSFNASSTAPIDVVSTANFLSAGGLIVGTEIIAYTGKTDTTFTGITRGVLGTVGASHSSGAQISEAQTITPPATQLPIAFTSTDTSNEVSIDPAYNTRVVFAVSGYYNIQFSAQMLNFVASEDDVVMWFRKNGTDVANSAGVVTIPAKHGTRAGSSVTSWNLVIDIMAGDYIELLMTSATGNTVVATYPPGVAPAVVHPVSPSIILTATFVSALFT